MSSDTLVRTPDDDRASGGAKRAPWWRATARRIVQSTLWCVIEARSGGADAPWEPRWLICLSDEDRIVSAVADWFSTRPIGEVRLAGYTRNTLRRDERAPTAVIQGRA